MLKLKLDKIKKTYFSGEEVIALRDVSLGFRESEFVAILGPSGCGKTTLLNIIGGLDRYDSGDLIINGMSTKKFKDKDWDAYRNRSIGFVFQSYNLIGHQTVLQNVEIAMTLSGVSASERKRRALAALEEVGIADQHKKKPNQLSGGQMQRVAIARALVNNPDIILADEPTGALDSQTSVQLMDILHEIAKTRLVIMVTHNGELAEKYSNRIVCLLDGSIQSDTNPVPEEEANGDFGQELEKNPLKKTAMSLFTATSLSFKNLLTKRGRTIMTAFAGSIGIIGVALVLALSAGLSTYMASMQSSTLSGYPITITTGEQSIDFTQRPGSDNEATTLKEYPNTDVLYAYDSEKNSTKHSNIITSDYLDYVAKIDSALPGAVNNIAYTQGVNINLLAKGKDTVVKFDTTVSFGGGQMNFLTGGNTYWGELPDNDKFILSLYDLTGEGSRLPKSKNEVVLVVDKYNRIDKAFFEKLGITEDTEKYKLTDFIGKTILSVIPNDEYYSKSKYGSLYSAAIPSDYETLYQSESGTKLTIVGVLRPKADSESSYLSPGIAYTTALTAAVVENAKGSEIALAQGDTNRNVLFGTPFQSSKAKDAMLQMLGADTTPTGINIYPKNYASKDEIKTYLDAYNDGKATTDQLVYSDLAEAITSVTKTLLSTITYVLVGFAAISLVVSTIMISIITYVSVIERTKEIGILRSVGARKKDISRVFNAETLLIGFSAGVLGVGLSYLLSIPINVVINNLTGISGISALNPVHAVLLIVGSMLLTLIAGFIPSRMAAQKDPVIALRSE
jgi:putative ABC transport system permease protein